MRYSNDINLTGGVRVHSVVGDNIKGTSANPTSSVDIAHLQLHPQQDDAHGAHESDDAENVQQHIKLRCPPSRSHEMRPIFPWFMVVYGHCNRGGNHTNEKQESEQF